MEDQVLSSLLSHFGGDLWLSRRLRLDEVASHLEEANRRQEAAAGDSKRPIETTEWLRFIKFLETDCSGRQFTNDKQWSELMNLMQISRKLNHRSVKFKDILRNRAQIESAAPSIHRLNESARLGETIESSLDDLESLLQASRLELPTGGDTIRMAALSPATLLLANELSTARSYLQERCRPILYTLKPTIGDPSTSALDPRGVAWLERISRLETTLDRLDKFLRSLHELECKLVELEPLVSVDGDLMRRDGQHKPPARAQQQQFGSPAAATGEKLSESKASCKAKFQSAQEFYSKLIESLRTLAPRNLAPKPTPLPTTTATTTRTRTSAATTNKTTSKTRASNSGPAPVDTPATPIVLPLMKLLDSGAANSKRGTSGGGGGFKLAHEMYDSGLSQAIGSLDECRSTLDKMMRQLRLEFGRFYFVNDLELLKIIALDTRLITDSASPDNQRLLTKLFNNSIGGFEMAQNGTRLVGVKSPFNEVIGLLDEHDEQVAIKKQVSVYSVEVVRIFNETLRKLRRTLRRRLLTSLGDSSSVDLSAASIDWSLPVQLVNVAESVHFCRRVERCFKTRANLTELIQFYEQRFQQLSGLQRRQQASDGEATSGDQLADNRLLDFKRSVAISSTVSFISTLHALQANRVSDVQDWHWQKLVRYYVIQATTPPDDKKLDLEVRVADTKSLYKFDYLPLDDASGGISTSGGPGRLHSRPTFKRLISTQVTERCFLVASQAVRNFRLGASPFGPAGSGKTETIKALGQLLGCQVIVHNCDESNDSESLDRLVWGLAHTGLWGCFDEFNRLSSATLSSVSATLELVQTGIRANEATVELADGSLMSLDPSSAFFVTLNPASSSSSSSSSGDGDKGGNYGGRRRLPANLRSLFLPVAMVRVEIGSIVSEKLLSMSGELGMLDENGGFRPKDAIRLGEQLHSWLDWMRSTVGTSTVGRCEWDLRLVIALLKRLKVFAAADRVSSIDQLLVRAIRCEVEPRLARSELEVLRGGLVELGLAAEAAAATVQLAQLSGTESDHELRGRLKQALEGESVQSGSVTPATAAQATNLEQRALQLNEQLETRTGVILLGQPGSGKSASWRALSEARGESIKWLAVNPRSCDKRWLFGFVDMKTRKWTDGILTARVREAQRILEQQQQQLHAVEQVWIVLDGPVDPDWIESLNSVLDDNQVLTLSSGERLNFTLPATSQSNNSSSSKSIKLIFETTSTRLASPATISRLGLVFYEHCQRADNQPGSPSHRRHPASLFILHATGASCRSPAIKWSAAHIASHLPHSGESSAVIVEYNCNQFSNSSHLLEWLRSNDVSQAKGAYFLLNNVSSIQAEDQWGTKSLLELLRFVLTYGGFYDTASGAAATTTFKRCEFKFVLTVASNELELLDPRLLSLAQLVQVSEAAAVKNETAVKMMKANSFDTRWLESELLLAPRSAVALDRGSTAATILGLSSDSYGLGRRKTVLELAAENNWQTFSFCNSQLARQSLESLEELLLLTFDGAELNQKTANAGATNRPKLFVLSEFESESLEPQLRSQLYHRLNWLRAGTTTATQVIFVYLTHNIHLEQHESIFWCSMSQVYHFGCDDDDDDGANDKLLISDISQRLRTKLTTETDAELTERPELRVSQQQVDWLVERFAAFIKSSHLSSGVGGSKSTTNWRLFEAHGQLLAKLLSGSRAHLLDQRRQLGNGLERLREFESSVERIKSRCQVEKTRLVAKRAEIERLMRKIDSELGASQEQRSQANKLRAQQEAKGKELETKQRRVELELAKVLPMIESSKSSIGQHLKPEALNEIKSLRSPPKVIKDILDVVFLLLGIEDSSWTEVKAYLTRCSLKDALTGYDFGRLAADNNNNNGGGGGGGSQLLARVESLIESKRDSFDPRQAARASKAIVPILDWIQAALEYGRVLLRLRPLNQEMERLKQESGELKEQLARIEAELKEIDLRIQAETVRLEQLKREQAESEAASHEAELRLERAQRARAELDNPINRWRLRRQSVESILAGDELIKLCLAASCLALFSSTNNNDGGPLETSFLKPFGLDASLSAGEFVSKMLSLWPSLLAGDDTDDPESMLLTSRRPDDDCGSDGGSRLLRLLILRLQLEPSLRPLVAFLDVDTTQVTANEVIEGLCFRGLVCGRKENVLLLRPAANHQDDDDGHGDKLGEFESQVALAARLKRLVVIEMHNEPARDLDIMDLVLRRAPQGARIILMGQLDKLSESVQRLLLPSRSWQQHVSNIADQSGGGGGLCSVTSVESAIKSRLINFYEPKLSAQAGELERQLESKHKETRSLESSLLASLANLGSKEMEEEARILDGGAGGRAVTASVDLVALMSDLRQSSAALETQVAQLEAKMEDWRAKQEEYLECSREAASFYCDHLAELGQTDRFYHMPLDTYIRLLLLDANGERRCKSASKSAIDYGRILRLAMRPMRPKFRQQFENKLRETSGQRQLVVGLDSGGAASELQLEHAMLDFLEDDGDDDLCDNAGRQLPGARLMVLLHDPEKSSPQLEVDEFFRRQQQQQQHQQQPLSLQAEQAAQRRRCYSFHYSKVYATGESAEKLELALTSAPSRAAATAKAASGKPETGGQTLTRPVVCIVNAHLSSHWINTRLLGLMDSPASTGLLVILVGESSIDSGRSNFSKNNNNTDKLDSSLLDRARVKYWHDELALGPANRFRLFERSIGVWLAPPTNRTAAKATTTAQRHNDESSLIMALARQSVLFHVVCQERAKQQQWATTGAADGCWRKSYSFDYDQLCLALKTLARLFRDQRDTIVDKQGVEAALALRRRFCHYLESIVYGARLESVEDELALVQLIKRLLLGAHAAEPDGGAKLQLAKLDKLEVAAKRATDNDGAMIQYKTLLSDLIGPTRE